MKKFACLIPFLIWFMSGCSAPEADFSVTTAFTTVHVSASTSTATSYTWSWGDNTKNSYGSVASHTYSKSGDYSITLSVEDNGKYAEKTKKIHVSSQPGGGGGAGTTTSYKAFICNSIKVTKMPLRDGSSRWDANSDADLFFRIYNTNSSSSIYECSNYVQNVSSLPVTKKLSKEVTFYKEKSYKIELLDYDDFSANDLIGSVSFSGTQLFSNGVTTTVTLKNSSGTISIDLLGRMD